jgi:hypothetical protein
MNQSIDATKVTDFDYAFVNKDCSYRQISKANLGAALASVITGANPEYGIRSVSVNTTYTSADSVILINTTSANRTVNVSALDLYNTTTSKSRLLIVKQTSAANTAFIAPTSGTIDGSSSNVSITGRGWIALISDGSNMHIVGLST